MPHDTADGRGLLATEAAARVLAELEERSRHERPELDALDPRGAADTGAAAPRLMPDAGPDLGRLLNVLARTLQARRVVEIGGSVGYSAIWLAAAVAETGGEVISTGMDQGKAAELSHNVAQARLAEYVRVVPGRAGDVLPGLSAPFDLVLIHHGKDRRIDEFELAWPKVRVGGLVAAGNILVPGATAALMDAYVRHVRSVPCARSGTLAVGGGIEVTVRIAAEVAV